MPRHWRWCGHLNEHVQSDNENLLLLLKRLSDCGVNFTLIGGMAAIAHGSSMVTKDVDVCSPMIEANLARILSALRDLHPRHRMRPDLAVPDGTLPAY